MFNGTINPDGTSSLNQTGQPANAETLTKWVKDNTNTQNAPLPGYLRPSNPAYASASNSNSNSSKFKIKITSFDD